GLNTFATDGSWSGAKVTIGSTVYTIASVTDSTHLQLTTSAGTQTGVTLMLQPQYAPWGTTYYLQTNANPSTDTWHQVLPTAFPIIGINSALVHDPDNDVLFAFGTDGSSQTHNDWLYCPTDRNPTPGALTAKQLAAGCRPDNWIEVPSTG